MKKFLDKYRLWLVFAVLATIFIVYTLLVKFVDVRVVNVLPTDFVEPQIVKESSIGFSSMNVAFRDLVGNTLCLYKATDLGSLITVVIGAIFLTIGIVEWVKRKNILKVDANILALGLFYIADLIVFLLFNFIAINYRPWLLENNGQWVLEPSYPSSTSLLGITLLISCIDQINIYIKKNKPLRLCLIVICVLLTAFFVIGRALSGVHWLSDIIGGVILATVLMSLYMAMKHSIAKATHQQLL